MRNTSQPILVTGSHRSGSSWVGRMIAQSSQIGEIWEPLNIHNRPGICTAKFNVWFPYINDENGYKYKAAIQDCLSFSYRYGAELRAIRNITDLARMIRDVTHFAIWKSKKSRPLQKDPMALFSAEWLAKTYHMQVIVLIRHPAAFASSLKVKSWDFPFSHFLSQPALINDHLQDFEKKIALFAEKEQPLIDQANLLWNIFNSVILKYKNKYSNWLFIRHEDLSRDPLSNFEDIYNYIGLDFTEAIKDKIRSYSGAHNPKEQHHHRSVRRNSIENIHNWKNRLSIEEIAQTRLNTAQIANHFYTDVDW